MTVEGFFSEVLVDEDGMSEAEAFRVAQQQIAEKRALLADLVTVRGEMGGRRERRVASMIVGMDGISWEDLAVLLAVAVEALAEPEWFAGSV